MEAGTTQENKEGVQQEDTEAEMAKRIDIDIERVEELAGIGLTEQEICNTLGVSRSTLLRRKKDNADFAEAIQRGKAKAHAVVASALFELCKQGNLGAIIWYEKSRCGMRDNTHITHEMKPLEIEGYDYNAAIANIAPPDATE